MPQGPITLPKAPSTHSHTVRFPLPGGLPRVTVNRTEEANRWLLAGLPLLAFAVFWLYRLVRRYLRNSAPLDTEPYFFPIEADPFAGGLFRDPDVRIGRDPDNLQRSSCCALRFQVTNQAVGIGHRQIHECDLAA